MKKNYRVIANVLLALIIFITSISSNGISATATSKNVSTINKTETMEVHFIDVGQGDSALVKCGEHYMLIDAGDNSKGTTIQNYLKKQKVDKLDYLVLTHPDADHIGGAPVIITKLKISKVFVSNFEKYNNSYQKLIQALDNKRLKYSTPKVGSQYTLGSATITILAPNGEYDNPNDSSVSLMIQNGENKFLFTGDAGEAAEYDILKNNTDISADVYKVGHHGSKYSTSQDFFKAVNPTYAVISCGENNSYGHPHAETLNTLRKKGVAVYRTDEDGTIIATSDGEEITFNVPASETWKAGEPTGSSDSKTQTQSQVQQSQPQTQPKNENKETAPIVEEPKQETSAPDTTEVTYVLNTKTKKFHRTSCGSLPTTNRKDTSESRDSVIASGYAPCKKCNP